MYIYVFERCFYIKAHTVHTFKGFKPTTFVLLTCAKPDLIAQFCYVYYHVVIHLIRFKFIEYQSKHSCFLIYFFQQLRWKRWASDGSIPTRLQSDTHNIVFILYTHT